MKKVNKAILVPAVLLVYLAVMAYIGLDGLKSGQTPLWQYVITIIASLIIIVALHFVLKKRQRLAQERTEDIENTNNS
jgi:membrane protein implicated in regulation of membrane protease activity